MNKEMNLFINKWSFITIGHYSMFHSNTTTCIISALYFLPRTKVQKAGWRVQVRPGRVWVGGAGQEDQVQAGSAQGDRHAELWDHPGLYWPSGWPSHQQGVRWIRVSRSARMKGMWQDFHLLYGTWSSHAISMALHVVVWSIILDK